jgi:CubicO group peptidase (beta-lactamase class C family)
VNVRNPLPVLVLVAAALTSCAGPSRTAGKTIEARLDAYLAAAHKLDRFSGSVLVASHGRIVICKGYGMANYELDVLNTPKTKFRLGSVSKQFAAMAILQLEENGKLKVTDTVRTVLPDYPPSGDKITIGNLLTHTSGIPNMTEFPDYVKTMSLPSTPQQTVDRFKGLPLEFAPGERFSYSNSNYILLGAIVEKVTSRPYEEYVREHIFQVLGMEDTGYDHNEVVLKNRASGYEFRGDRLANAPYIDMSIPFAAGALYSTVEDLYKWDRALYTDKLLSKAGRDRMFTPFKGGYAYGWMIGELYGHKNIRHGGGINGFVTDISRFPDDDACVIVLCNYLTGYLKEISDALAGILLGQAIEPPKEEKFIKLPAAVLEGYCGRYRVEGAKDVFTVSREGQILFIQVGDQPRTLLGAVSETKFFMRALGFWVTFVKDGQGRVTHFILTQGSRETKMIRVE